MDKISKWLKNKIATIAIATSNVEKNALSQEGSDLTEGIGKIQSHKQGSLEDDLVQGRLTEQVKELRWRMYKIYEESKKYSTRITGLSKDSDHNPIYTTQTNSLIPKKITDCGVDPFDDYPLEIILDNKEYTLTVSEMLGVPINELSDDEKYESIFRENEKSIKMSWGDVKLRDLNSKFKNERSININRTIRPKFEIENFSKKIHIRTITDKSKLLEFYISKYPNPHDTKSKPFISELNRSVKNPRSASLFDMDSIEFVTYNTLGYKDSLYFKYDIKSFDKMVEYDGFYIIKFLVDVSVNGKDLTEEFTGGKLEEKYKNKETK